MRIGVLGTGTVGQRIASKLVELGHEVRIGSRTPDNASAVEWASSAGEGASHGTFADAAAFGEVLFNCTSGGVSIEVLRSAGTEDLRGKVLVDVANTLDFSQGAPPTLLADSKESLAEQIQSAFPELRVVKTLNTMNNEVMVDPSVVPGEHDVFVSGDDENAKQTVRELLRSFGWPEDHIVDLGGISTARGQELYFMLWLALWGALGTPSFNIRVVR